MTSGRKSRRGAQRQTVDRVLSTVCRCKAEEQPCSKGNIIFLCVQRIPGRPRAACSSEAFRRSTKAIGHLFSVRCA